MAEATLELHFCVEHKKNVDQNDLIAFAVKAFWSENSPLRTEVDEPRIGIRWERSNPGVIVKDDAQTGLS
jgi:dTDP-4-dehydrorhamnose 3,5-epimerase-like enzyme